MGFASKPWWFRRPPTLVSLAVSPAGGLSGLSAFSVHLLSRGLLPPGWSLGACKGGGGSVIRRRGREAGWAGEEAEKRSGLSWKPASAWSRQPRRKAVLQPCPPSCSAAVTAIAAGVGSSNFPWEGTPWAKGSSPAPVPAAGREATAQGGGSWQSASSKGICLSLWCVFQHPKRISPALRGLDLKSNHPKHSTEI